MNTASGSESTPSRRAWSIVCRGHVARSRNAPNRLADETGFAPNGAQPAQRGGADALDYAHSRLPSGHRGRDEQRTARAANHARCDRADRAARPQRGSLGADRDGVGRMIAGDAEDLRRRVAGRARPRTRARRIPSEAHRPCAASLPLERVDPWAWPRSRAATSASGAATASARLGRRHTRRAEVHCDDHASERNSPIRRDHEERRSRHARQAKREFVAEQSIANPRMAYADDEERDVVHLGERREHGGCESGAERDPHRRATRRRHVRAAGSRARASMTRPRSSRRHRRHRAPHQPMGERRPHQTAIHGRLERRVDRGLGRITPVGRDHEAVPPVFVAIHAWSRPTIEATRVDMMTLGVSSG